LGFFQKKRLKEGIFFQELAWASISVKKKEHVRMNVTSGLRQVVESLNYGTVAANRC